MPELILPLVLAKASPSVATLLLSSDAGRGAAPLNVLRGPLQPCVHEGSPTGYQRDNMCHAPGDPDHHEVCAHITPQFWRESGQGSADISGDWCICVHKLGDWLRATKKGGLGITGIDCRATSIDALRGDADAARYVKDHCPSASSIKEVLQCVGPIEAVDWVTSRLAARMGRKSLAPASPVHFL
mmetsp:Transcript_111306/g.315089  ORF Transcript_111306/g.315089 Transcript_111306/m.315089 type:complete len:185 (-) Transcript_111306:40-594(-)